MNPLLALPAVRLALLAAAVAAPVAAQSFGTVDTKTYGNWLAGGSTTMRANANVTLPSPTNLLAPTSVQASASNVASVRLFGTSREAAAMTTSVRVDHEFAGLANGRLQFRNTSAGSFAVRLAGATVLSDARTNTTLSNNLAADVFVSDVPTHTVSLLGYGVTVRGGATGRARYTLTPSFSFANGMSVALDGPIRTSAVGTAGASVGALGVTVGVASTLTFADTNANLAISATPGGVTGGVSGTIQQIRFVIDVFASFAGATASQRLVNHSSPAENFNKVLAPQ
jgi:hypothetical protein